MMNNKNFRVVYSELKSPQSGADMRWFQRRGYEFEKIINFLLAQDDLDPRLSYKASGEQIDGSFVYNGKYFLLEAKWHATEFPVSALYQFQGKVDGKLVGTIGVFISMSGYSSEAADALIRGKTLNTILFDQNDFDAAMRPDIGFKKVLETKLRQAADEGTVYFPFESALVDSRQSTLTPTEEYAASGDIAIICEGNLDKEIISLIAQRVFREKSLERKLKIVISMGKFALPKIARSIKSLLKPGTNLAIVADADDSRERTMNFLMANIDESDWVAIIPDPSIENWFSSTASEFKRDLRPDFLVEKVAALDLETLAKENESFGQFYNFLQR